MNLTSSDGVTRLADALRDDLLNRLDADERTDVAFADGSDWTLEQVAVLVLTHALAAVDGLEDDWNGVLFELVASRLENWLVGNRQLSNGRWKD